MFLIWGLKFGQELQLGSKIRIWQDFQWLKIELMANGPHYVSSFRKFFGKMRSIWLLKNQTLQKSWLFIDSRFWRVGFWVPTVHTVCADKNYFEFGFKSQYILDCVLLNDCKTRPLLEFYGTLIYFYFIALITKI